MATSAFFPGSFDPLTNGHLDILVGALALADRVVLGIGINPHKKPLFSPEARVEMLSEVVATLGDAASRTAIVHYEGLLVDAAREAGATVIIRGLRDAADVSGELSMAAMNFDLAPDLQTVLLPAAPVHRHISATLVRQVAEMGGDVSAFVPPAVARRLTELR
jgi:pantetheine-phosphate adenylyltransferase